MKTMMNMMNSLDKIKIIDRTKLDDEFYFSSLLEQGSVNGLIADVVIERIQLDCLKFLAHKVERFNSGDSSSIRVEKAQDILASIMFTIGLWLKTYNNPDDAIVEIRNVQITELYERGLNRIKTLVTALKTIHSMLRQKLLNTENVFYNATIVDGINGFFKLYYPEYGAHEIHITADYPVYNPVPKLAGIEFIYAYVKALYYENQFCINFSPDDIRRLLLNYHKGYQGLLINIYEHVLTAAIGCILTGADVHKLILSEDGVARLQRLFSGKSKSKILIIIQRAVHDLGNIFTFSDELNLYIRESLHILKDQIAIAINENFLDRIFIY